MALAIGVALGLGAGAARADAGTPAAPDQGAAPASDQEGREEILVTARKRSESLMDIPASVQAIPSSVIEERHMTQLDDIGAMVSNLNIFEAHDNSPAVVMRGVGSFELVQGVGFYMNDVQLYEGQTVRPADVARIEVLKGPQGTLYGGANIGGAIKYITKDPTPDWANEATLEVGNYYTANALAVISGPISDKLGMRLSAFDDNHQGYITDTYHDEKIGAGHEKGARLVFLADPEVATNVRLTFNADDYNSSNENLQYRVTEVGNATAPYTADAYRYTVDDYFLPSYIRKLFATSLEANHQFASGVTLTSITSQFWSYNRGITDFTKQPRPIDELFQNLDQRVVSEELRLTSTAHTDLDWLVGIFVQRHSSDVTNSDLNYEVGPSPYPMNLAPVPDNWLADQQLPFDYDVENKVQKVYALFGDMTYYLGDWNFELGLRAEDYSSVLSARNQPSIGTPPPAPPPTLVFMPQQSLWESKLSPRVSVQYRFSKDTNAYATYAAGFQPGDLQEENLEIDRIRPETANSYELGMKSRLSNGVQFTAAVFLVDYKDRWYQTFKAIPGSFLDITTNIGASRNTGIETDFVAPLTKEFKLNGGIGTTRSRWGNVLFGDPQLTGLSGGTTPIYRNIEGLTPPFTPAYSANLALEWNHPMANGDKVGAQIDGNAVGQSYWEPNDFARQKAYQLMNLGAHYDTSKWTFIAHCTNVTGTRYNSMYWDSWDVGGIPHSFGRIGRPRMYAASATYRF